MTEFILSLLIAVTVLGFSALMSLTGKMRRSYDKDKARERKVRDIELEKLDTSNFIYETRIEHYLKEIRAVFERRDARNNRLENSTYESNNGIAGTIAV